ncbi:MAG: class I SAM-dependent methyltransferase [Alkalibacterium sp.]|nr:class I SAM-dependent methyltransferase [Alkalibacterium sp.]
MSYNWFAKVYDQLMDDSLYEKWLEYTLKHVPVDHSLLELGCGTGILGILLKEKGYPITGLDLSEEMLSLAYDRQLESDTVFPLIQRNMMDLSELPEYDAVICYSDALCYMEDEEALLKVFKEVHSVLTADGVFLFDVHSPLQIEAFMETSYHAEVDEIVFLWDSYEGEHDYSVEHHLTFFVETKEDTYERFEEIHKERTYLLEDYLRMLKTAGFKHVNVTGDFREELAGDSKRWFFDVRK